MKQKPPAHRDAPGSDAGPGRAADRDDVEVSRIGPGRCHIVPAADGRPPRSCAAPGARVTPGMPGIAAAAPGAGSQAHPAVRWPQKGKGTATTQIRGRCTRRKSDDLRDTLAEQVGDGGDGRLDGSLADVA